MVLYFISWVSISVGIFFILVGAIGLIRMPDLFSRMHAAGLVDTVGAGFLLVGFLMQSNDWIVSIKLLMIFAFLIFTSPVATHALAHAALLDGIAPWTKRNHKDPKP